MILHTGWLHPLHVQVRLGFGATDMSKQELKKIIDSARIFLGLETDLVPQRELRTSVRGQADVLSFRRFE